MNGGEEKPIGEPKNDNFEWLPLFHREEEEEEQWKREDDAMADIKGKRRSK